MFLYKGGYALVTGASKGLGSAYAEVLAKRGMNVVLAARSLQALQLLAGSLRERYGVRVEVVQVDLANPSAVDVIANELHQFGIRIDLLINNAGAGLSGQFLRHPVEKELAQISLNIQGLVALTHHFGKEMASKGAGGIINLASNAAFQPVPYMATYGATKAFALLFTEALAEEVRGKGVRVMAACPGPTSTEFFKEAPTTLKPSEMDTAEFVAERTLKDFDRGETVSYPGRLSVRIFSLAPRLLSRSTAAKVAAMFSRKMGYAE